MLQDLSGEVFGWLTVVSYAGSLKHKRTWLCNCRCGGTIVVRGGNLKSGLAKSCGCIRREQLKARNKASAKHNMFGTPEYISWSQMKARCQDPAHTAFKDYGGRGITVCERWQDFIAFFADMGRRPSKKHSIERKDNNAGYSPNNCVWATMSEQANNKRNTRRIKYCGKYQPLTLVAKAENIRPGTLRQRIDRQGMTEEEAVSTPVRGWVHHG